MGVSLTDGLRAFDGFHLPTNTQQNDIINFVTNLILLECAKQKNKDFIRPLSNLHTPEITLQSLRQDCYFTI